MVGNRAKKGQRGWGGDYNAGYRVWEREAVYRCPRSIKKRNILGRPAEKRDGCIDVIATWRGGIGHMQTYIARKRHFKIVPWRWIVGYGVANLQTPSFPVLHDLGSHRVKSQGGTRWVIGAANGRQDGPRAGIYLLHGASRGGWRAAKPRAESDVGRQGVERNAHVHRAGTRNPGRQILGGMLEPINAFATLSKVGLPISKT